MGMRFFSFMPSTMYVTTSLPASHQSISTRRAVFKTQGISFSTSSILSSSNLLLDTTPSSTLPTNAKRKVCVEPQHETETMLLRAATCSFFLACLALLITATTSLETESHWSWTNALSGALVTHILVGHLYFSKAIDICCLQAQAHMHARPWKCACVRACVTLATIECSGFMFFGAFGAHLGGVMLKSKQSFPPR